MAEKNNFKNTKILNKYNELNLYYLDPKNNN